MRQLRRDANTGTVECPSGARRGDLVASGRSLTGVSGGRSLWPPRRQEDFAMRLARAHGPGHPRPGPPLPRRSPAGGAADGECPHGRLFRPSAAGRRPRAGASSRGLRDSLATLKGRPSGLYTATRTWRCRDTPSYSRSAAEPVRLKPDVLVVSVTELRPLAAKKATSTIPIVMAVAVLRSCGCRTRREPRPARRQRHRPVPADLRPSLKGSPAPEGKPSPKPARVGALRYLTEPLQRSADGLRDAKEAAKSLGVELKIVELGAPARA